MPSPRKSERTCAATVELVSVEDGVRLRTWTTGRLTSSPAALLLHGGPGMWDYLAPLAAVIGGATVVHRFDQRGCGGSDASHEHTLARYLADLEALRRHWGHERWVVIGHSFGASLALAYGAQDPHRLSGLGYLAGTGIGDWHDDYVAERQRRMSDDQRDRLRVLGGEADRWSGQQLQVWARAITVPGLVLHGELDPRPVRTARLLADELPAAELVVVAGAGHEPWLERPDLVAAALRRLLDRA